MSIGTDSTLIKVEELDSAQTSNSYLDCAVHPIPVSSDSLSSTYDDPATYQRVVLLIPNVDVREAMLVRRVSDIALCGCASVLLLTINNDWTEEPNVRLKLALLTAMLREVNLTVNVQIHTDIDWLGLVRATYLGGDLVVCLSEHTVTNAALGSDRQDQSMSHALIRLHIKTCELQGYAILPVVHLGWKQTVMQRLLPFGIVLAMFVLQAIFIHATPDWGGFAHKAVLISTVALEIYLVMRISI